MEDKENQATEVRANFAYDINYSNQSITLWQEGNKIVLSYWECFLLHRILDRNIIN